ncbi:MAG: YbaB/EbfC family nucleoid-associated protein [Actinomycetota bacterium]|nr:YbaB/EbfC family nucleoid-associated protein [Actinomycetota bacterium]
MQPGEMPDMAALMQQATQMQEQLMAAQQELAQAEITGSAGGGLVSVTMTGAGEVTAVAIQPDAVDPEDIESLQDLIVAAIRDGNRQVGELTSQTMGPLAGGLGGLGLPGM